MPVQRCPEQTGLTIEEFYSEKEMGLRYACTGKPMLQFIAMINALFPETLLFGMTSHFRLRIQKEDLPGLDWFVIVSAVASDFYFEYLMPEQKAPWKNAYYAEQPPHWTKQKKYLLTAMNECGAWRHHAELHQLQAGYGMRRAWFQKLHRHYRRLSKKSGAKRYLKERSAPDK